MSNNQILFLLVPFDKLICYCDNDNVLGSSDEQANSWIDLRFYPLKPDG